MASTDTISLTALAAELGVTCVELAQRVDDLIAEHGETAVIATVVRRRGADRRREEHVVLTADAARRLRPAPTAKCGRCRRTLTAARSVALGYGRTCQTRIAVAAKAAAALFKPAQIVKAVDAIELHAVIRTAGTTYAALSSAGDVAYRVELAAGTCTCPAGQHGRACYHLAAAAILVA